MGFIMSAGNKALLKIQPTRGNHWPVGRDTPELWRAVSLDCRPANFNGTASAPMWQWQNTSLRRVVLIGFGLMAAPLIGGDRSDLI